MPLQRIEVPASLWCHATTGAGLPYGANQAEDWTDAFDEFVRTKGTVPPGLYRAFGYEPPSRRIKLKWRELRLSLGKPAAGSSPAAQQALELNRDATFRPGRGEGERLR